MEKLNIYEFKKAKYSLEFLQKECNEAFPERIDDYAIYAPDNSDVAYFVFTEEGFKDVVFEHIVAELDRKPITKEDFIRKEGVKINGGHLGSYRLFRALRLP